MKKILLASLVLLFTACGSYKTMSGGKADQSYVVVLSSGDTMEGTVVVIDGVQHQLDKVYKEKHAKKATPIIIPTGKHLIKISSEDKVLYEQNIFVGAQQTKKIIL